MTPALGVVCVILIFIFCQEPPRGMSEGGDVHLKATSVTADLKDLIHKLVLFFFVIVFHYH